MRAPTVLAPVVAVLGAAAATLEPRAPPVAPHAEPPSAIVVELPVHAAAAMEITEPTSGVTVRVSLERATAIPGERDGASVRFPGALDGFDTSIELSASKVEDFVHFDAEPRSADASWRVELVHAAGLRLVDDVLEVLDHAGAPRLRMNRPWLRDARGAVVRARTAIAGCDFDASPRGPWRRPPIAPGAAACTIRVSWSPAAVVYPATLDPAWTPGSDMVDARSRGIATSTGDGRVVVAGGYDGVMSLSSAELFDPSTGTWSVTAPMGLARDAAPSVMLEDGRVLVAGGENSLLVAIATSETYEPALGTWASADLGIARANATLTRVADGSVIAAGGNALGYIGSVERFDPGADAWSPAGALVVPRASHGAVPLPDGRVLIAGGEGDTGILAAVEAYSPATGVSEELAPLLAARSFHALVVDEGGAPLAVGGSTDVDPFVLDAVEAYDPLGDVWTPRAPLPEPRESAFGIRFATGRILLVGGDGVNDVLYEAVAYGPGDAWSPAGSTTPRIAPVVFGLADGRAVVAGGVIDRAPSASVELFVPLAPGAPCVGTGECAGGLTCVDGVCCESACEGVCRACSVAGVCEPVALADDPDTCTGESTCGATATCGLVDGSACADPGACASGLCVDGVCCDAVCDGSCESCTAQLGRCLALVGDGDGRCEPGFTCTGSDPDCVAIGTCEEGHVIVALDGTRQDCSPYACSSDVGCNQRCATFEDCAVPFLCDASGACVLPERSADASCSAAVPSTPPPSHGLLALALFALLRRRTMR